MRSSIRNLLIALICGSIFVSFLALLIVVRHVLIDDYKTIIETNDEKIAMVLSENINQELNRAFVPEIMAGEYFEMVKAPDLLQRNIMTNAVNRDKIFDFLAITDNAGRNIIYAPDNLPGISKISYGWFQHLRVRRESGISPLYYSEATKNLTFTYLRRLEFDGEDRGAIIGDINLDSLRDMIKKFNEESDSEIYVLDANGNSVIQPKDDGRTYNYTTMKYSEPVKDASGNIELDTNGHVKVERKDFKPEDGFMAAVAEVLQGENGSLEYTDAGGNRYFCYYESVPLTFIPEKNWSLILVHPVSSMIGMLDKIMWRALFVGIFLIIAIGLALTRFTKIITDPVKEMAAMANRVRAGDLSGQLDIKSKDEFGELADNINHMILGLREVRKKNKETEIHFKAIAYHDALTGLPNRNHFLVRFRNIIEKSVVGRFYGALIFIDADKFKSINDTYGHAVGDGLLIDFGKRIVEIVGNADCVCRYGGDEFVAFLLGYNETDAHSVCNALVKKMREPFKISGHEFQLSASVGAALMPKDAVDLDDLMEKADAALYVSKRNGRDQFNFYQVGMETAPKKDDR